MELALATRTHPAEWVDAPPELVATVIDVLAEQGRRAKRGR